MDRVGDAVQQAGAADDGAVLVAGRGNLRLAGRDAQLDGYPIKMSEMLALIKGAVYIERTAVNSPAHIQRTKKAILKAFQTQIDGIGYSLVEILSPCPTNWKMTPVESWQWIDNEMSKEFPLGVIKDITGAKNAD